MSAKRSLLLGILALQNNFIDRAQLLAAFAAWVENKSMPLGALLVQQKALSAEEHALLEALAAKHLERHGQDSDRSLAALSSAGSARRHLAKIADPDVQASLASLAVRQAALPVLDDAADPFATVSSPPADPTARFVIVRPHASGGLGKVSVAMDQELNRQVALKQIKEQYAENAEARSRFLLEAEITGGLEHPGIVPVYSLGSYGDGRPYYAMRFIKGDSLKEAIDRFYGKRQGDQVTRRQGVTEAGVILSPCHPVTFSSLEFRKLLGRFVDVCNAIAYAHSRGVLHRDLKPGNIMLGKYGETLIVDWGLAKAGVGEPSCVSDRVAGEETQLHPASSSEGSDTLPGSALGTPPYMSPEQAAGRLDELGPATDVYSLGATLYHLLTGRAPFTGNDTAEILQRVQAGDFAPPRREHPVVPPPLDAVCLKAMALHPDDRYHSTRELAEDVERWLADEPVDAWPEPRWVKARRWIGRHRTFVTGAAAALVVGLVVALIAAGLLTAKNEDLAAESLRHQQTNVKLKEESEKVQKASNKLAETNAELLVAMDAKNKALEKEKTARIELQSQLARNLCQRSFVQLDSGLLANSVHSMLLAYQEAPQSDPCKQSYRHLLAGQAQFIGISPFIHDGEVHSVSFSPDGKSVLTCSKDEKAQMWDLATCKPLGEPLREVLAAAFGSDSKRVIVGGRRGAQVWDVTTARRVGEPLLHKGWVVAVAFSPDGKTAITGSHDKTARLWDMATSLPLGDAMCHEGWVGAVAFSPDGKKAITGSSDKTARLWDAATGEPLTAPLSHGRKIFGVDLGEVVGVAFSRDGKRVLTGSHDGTARLWHSSTGKPLGETMRHDGRVSVVAFSPDDKSVLTGSWDNSARLWNAMTGEPLTEPLRHQDKVLAAAFSPDATRLVTVSQDKSVLLWEASTGVPLRSFFGHDRSVVAVAFSPDGKQVITGSHDRTARLWDAAIGRPLGAPLHHERSSRSTSSMPAVGVAAFSPDGKLAFTGERKTGRLWDTATGAPLVELIGHEDDIVAVAFSPDGRKVATGSHDKTLWLWDASMGRPLGQPLRNEDVVHAVAFSPDGERLLTGSDNAARLWSVTLGKTIAGPLRHKEKIDTLAFSLDGKQMLTGSFDQTAIWDAVTGKSLGKPIRHADPGHAAMRPDGKTLLIGSDRTAQLWDPVTGKPIGKPMLHEDSVFALAFGPHGKTVVTGSHDKMARLWDADTSRLLCEPLPHDGGVWRVAFAPDGTTVLTGCQDGTAQLWDVSTGRFLGERIGNRRHRATAFSVDGTTVLTAGLDGTARLWKTALLPPDEPKRLRVWVSVITGKAFNEHGVMRNLSQAEWLRSRDELEALGGDWRFN